MVILGFTLPVHAYICRSVHAALVAAPVAAPGGDEEQAAEGDEEEPVLTPLDLAQGVYDNFEEPPAGIKMWHFACCDDNLLAKQLGRCDVRLLLHVLARGVR